MAICWEKAVPLAFHLCCFNFSAVLVVRVAFPFGVMGRMWNSIVWVPDHCLFIYFSCLTFYVNKKTDTFCHVTSGNFVVSFFFFFLLQHYVYFHFVLF